MAIPVFLHLALKTLECEAAKAAKLLPSIKVDPFVSDFIRKQAHESHFSYIGPFAMLRTSALYPKRCRR